MKVVFIGSSSFGLKCLQEINSIVEIDVVGVVSSPREFKISYSKNKVKNVLFSDFSDFCIEQGIEYKIIKNGMSDEGLFEKIKNWEPDIFIVAGWYHMIPRKWLEYRKSYGLHASLLPDYSGGAPLVWAMINGERKTGITFFQMDEGVDSGPIIGQYEEKISSMDTISTLYERIEKKGIKLLRTYLPKMASGKFVTKEQNELNRRIFPQRSPDDGLIDLDTSYKEIFNFIKAQTKPYPGAFLLDNKNQKMIIWSCSCFSHNHKKELGVIIKYKSHIGISCSDGLIIPEKINYNGEDINFNSKMISKFYGKEYE